MHTASHCSLNFTNPFSLPNPTRTNRNGSPWENIICLVISLYYSFICTTSHYSLSLFNLSPRTLQSTNTGIQDLRNTIFNSSTPSFYLTRASIHHIITLQLHSSLIHFSTGMLDPTKLWRDQVQVWAEHRGGHELHPERPSQRPRAARQGGGSHGPLCLPCLTEQSWEDCGAKRECVQEEGTEEEVWMWWFFFLFTLEPYCTSRLRSWKPTKANNCIASPIHITAGYVLENLIYCIANC